MAKSKIRSYVPSFGTDCADNRSSVMNALDIASSVRFHGKRGKKPHRMGEAGFTDALPVGFREAVESAFRVIIGTFEAIEADEPCAEWAQRETLRIGGNNVSLRTVLATYLGESTGLSASQIRKAASLAAAATR
jgi:hypothetical protein